MGTSVGINLNTDGVFYMEISNSIGASRGAVASITSISGLSAALVMPFTIKLYKKTSLKKVILIGISMAVLACLGMTFTGSVYGLYFWAIVRGFSLTTYNQTLLAMLLANWYKDRLGLITGIVFSASGICGALFNPFFTNIITSSGVTVALLVRTAMVFLFTFPGSVFLLHSTPEDVGLEPYTSAKADAKSKKVSRGSSTGLPVNPKALVFLAVVVFNVFTHATSRTGDNLAGFADSLGMSPAQGAALASALMIGNVVSKLAVGIMNDKIGVIRTTVIGVGVTIVSVAALMLAGGNYYIMLVASFFAGICTAVATVCSVALVRYVYGNKGYTDAVVYISPVTALYALLTMSFGFLYDLTGGYYATFALIIVLDLISVLALVIIENRVKRASVQSAAV